MSRPNPRETSIAVLGTGTMGAPIANGYGGDDVAAVFVEASTSRVQRGA